MGQVVEFLGSSQETPASLLARLPLRGARRCNLTWSMAERQTCNGSNSCLAVDALFLVLEIR